MPVQLRNNPRRRDNRVVFPVLNLSIGGNRLTTLNWSYTGVLLCWPGAQPICGERIAGFFNPPPGAGDDETGAFDAIVVRTDPPRNQVALSMHRGSDQAYRILEMTLRRALRANW
ncbi:hypothetical protein [Azospirillum baldaniorum]|nr:hypothetical protein [Azospirillum baldaniorum]